MALLSVSTAIADRHSIEQLPNGILEVTQSQVGTMYSLKVHTDHQSCAIDYSVTMSISVLNRDAPESILRGPQSLRRRSAGSVSQSFASDVPPTPP